jgi:hypothetical protein
VALVFAAGCCLLIERSVLAMALRITPTGHWMGNDGPWSTFHVWVGDATEPFEVLPASSLSMTLVVLQEGCPQGAPTDCPMLRGNVFNTRNSSTWENRTQRDDSPFGIVSLPTERQFLGEDINSEMGVDFLKLDWPEDTSTELQLPLGGQFIAGIVAEPLFLGLLGLSGFRFYPISASDPYDSMLHALGNRSMISTLTWAYTAGAKYKTPESLGSLTFGGYDSSLVNMDEALTGVNFTGPPYGSGNELSLRIKSITVGESTESIGQVAILDSTLPDIWLPPSVCDVFVDKFHLQWNDTLQMYLISDEKAEQLTKENTSVSFDLMTDSDPDKVVKITLPYAAFYREVKYPLAGITDDTTLHYFPLKPMPDNVTDFRILLGRTFFQEA